MDKSEVSRWPLLRSGLIFQLKLGLDAARDLALSPVSFLLLAIDLVRGRPEKRSYFQRLMVFGYKTDQWINLFGTHHSLQKEGGSQDINVDRIFLQIESLLKEQHNKGGLTAAAKLSIDGYLDKLIKKGASGSKTASESGDSDA